MLISNCLQIMAYNSLENCFYEKRFNTSLHGYNNFHNPWTSDFDCLNRCLKNDPQSCRSFEHWHQNQYGLCVRANISLSDKPSLFGHTQYVNYYEIHCHNHRKILKASSIECPDENLYLTIELNEIDPTDVFLGDENCKSTWSNRTHMQFISHIDNCSLVLTNDSIIGKLHWRIRTKNRTFQIYERFVRCQTSLYRIRSNHRTTTNSRNLFSVLPHEQTAYRIKLQWTLHNRSYFCPTSCYISLYSLINITLGDLEYFSSKFSIDSCDLNALPPYTNYLQSTRLISQGLSTDPTVIFIPDLSPIKTFHFSFHLYHILKEPIPFEILCQIRQNDFEPMSLNSMIIFRSFSIHVTRQTPIIDNEHIRLPTQNSITSFAATVHYIECSLYAFFFLSSYII